MILYCSSETKKVNYKISAWTINQSHSVIIDTFRNVKGVTAVDGMGNCLKSKNRTRHAAFRPQRAASIYYLPRKYHNEIISPYFETGIS